MTEQAHADRMVSPAKTRGLSLWVWVAGAFLASLLAWVVMFKAAQAANVQPVPLAPRGGRP